MADEPTVLMDEGIAKGSTGGVLKSRGKDGRKKSEREAGDKIE
jgi:hypothetical protein